MGCKLISFASCSASARALSSVKSSRTNSSGIVQDGRLIMQERSRHDHGRVQARKGSFTCGNYIRKCHGGYFKFMKIQYFDLGAPYDFVRDGGASSSGNDYTIIVRLFPGIGTVVRFHLPPTRGVTTRFTIVNLDGTTATSFISVYTSKASSSVAGYQDIVSESFLDQSHHPYPGNSNVTRGHCAPATVYSR